MAGEYGISPVVISRWKSDFLEQAAEVFTKGPSSAVKELEDKRRILSVMLPMDYGFQKPQELIALRQYIHWYSPIFYLDQHAFFLQYFLLQKMLIFEIP